MPMNHLDMFQAMPDSEAMLARFNKLIQELLRGTMNRNAFQPWEIEILLDIQACELGDGSRRETLRRYQKAVQRAMEKGSAPIPFKLSEYLLSKKLAAAEKPRKLASGE